MNKKINIKTIERRCNIFFFCLQRKNLFFYFQNIEKLKKHLTFIKKCSINIKNKLKRGERAWVI